jgi:hypothetical protein
MSEIKTSRHFMERRTDTHVYFLTGPGSNWYPTVFEQSLAPDRPPRLFNCREQYIMARKKLVCGDPAGAEAVMKVGPPDMRPILDLLRTDPTAALRQFHPFAKEQKRIGRTAPYDEAAWSADRPAAASAGCRVAHGHGRPDARRGQRQGRRLGGEGAVGRPAHPRRGQLAGREPAREDLGPDPRVPRPQPPPVRRRLSPYGHACPQTGGRGPSSLSDLLRTVGFRATWASSRKGRPIRRRFRAKGLRLGGGPLELARSRGTAFRSDWEYL